MSPEVWDAMSVASREFSPLQDLHDAVGKRIAELTKNEAALVSAGAASAVAIGTAACVAGTDVKKIRCLPDTRGMKNEVIIQKSHRNGYDHAARNAGIRMIEVETVEELESAIHSRTAMMLFMHMYKHDGKIPAEEFARLGKKHKVPTLIDAADSLPPVEHLWSYTQSGFDLAAFSGGKGIMGPQSAGVLVGRKSLIEAGRLNCSPYSDSVCRISKVNKEEMVGMLVALERFVQRDQKAVWKGWEAQCDRIAGYVKGIKSVETETKVRELTSAVPHLHIRWDAGALGKSPAQAVKELREGEPSIELSPRSKEELVIAVWTLEPGEDRIIGRRVREVLTPRQG
jgi:L-seryl-tRNA(Ser) seleniumtransferase